MAIAMKLAARAEKSASALREKAARKPSRKAHKANGVRKPGGGDASSMSVVGTHHRPGESATVALGRHLYNLVTGGHEPSGKAKARLGQLVHWGYGMALASAYGAVRLPHRPRNLDLPGGLIFGLVLWAVGDELLVPLMGLSGSPREYPAAVHTRALAGHLAFGATAAATASALYRARVAGPGSLRSRTKKLTGTRRPENARYAFPRSRSPRSSTATR